MIGLDDGMAPPKMGGGEPEAAIFGRLRPESRFLAVWPAGLVPLVSPKPELCTLMMSGEPVRVFSWLGALAKFTDAERAGVAQICAESGQGSVETIAQALKCQPFFPMHPADICAVVIEHGAFPEGKP